MVVVPFLNVPHIFGLASKKAITIVFSHQPLAKAFEIRRLRFCQRRVENGLLCQGFICARFSAVSIANGSCSIPLTVFVEHFSKPQEGLPLQRVPWSS